MATPIIDVTSFSALLLATFLILLAGATVHYSIQTGRLVIETKRLRLPRLRADLEPHGPNQLRLSVRNTGFGTAEDVSLSFNTEPPSKAHSWQQNVLAPGEAVCFLIQDSESNPGGFDKTEELARAYDRLLVTGSYRDILGESYVMNEVLDLKRYQTQRAETIRVTQSIVKL